MQIGIGTYSFGGIEAFFGLAPALPDIFKKIKSLGYTCVELLEGDLTGHTVEELKQYMTESGIMISSVHAYPTKEIIDKLAAVGGKAVICAGSPFNTAAEAKELGEELDAMAEYAAPLGIKVCYHNHEHELYFTEGKTLLEHLYDNTKYLCSQLDCGWCMAGGTYPPSFIRKYRNRVALIHVKENNRVLDPGKKPAGRHENAGGGNPFEGIDPDKMSPEEKRAFVDMIKAKMDEENRPRFSIQCPMGDPSSNMNWKEIKAALDEQDFEAFWIVEREYFYKDHDECLKEDCAWLKENIARQ